MKTATPKQRQIIILLSIISTLIIIGFCYLLFTNIGHNSNNLALKDRILKITYQEQDYFSDLKKVSEKAGLKLTPTSFSIVNNGTLAMAYKIYLSHEQLDDLADQIYISFDGVEAQLLSSFAHDKNGYIIKDDVINATNNDYDYEVFNVRLWLAQKSTTQFSGQIKINVTSEVAMNLATDLIMAMNVNQNIDGLSYDLDDLPRYNGLNVHNYVLFNDELWRILGISQVRSALDREPLNRVLIIKDEPIAKKLWYKDKKHLVWDTINEYQTAIKPAAKSYIGSVIWGQNEEPTLFNLPSTTDYTYMSAWIDKSKPFWIYDALAKKVYTIDARGITEAYDDDENYVLPIACLKPTARIISGDGTIKNPYHIY